MSFVLALLRQHRRVARNRNLRLALFFFAALCGGQAIQPVPLAAQPAAQLLERAVELTDAGDYDAAVRDAQQAARLYATAGNARGQTDSLNQAGLAQLYAGDYDDARHSFHAALGVATAAKDAEGIVEIRMNLASADFFTGRYTDAAAHYAAAGAILDAHRNAEWTRRRRTLLLSNQATLDQRLGRHEEAIAAYRLALADTGALLAEEHAQMLANLGVLYRRMGDPYKALEHYDQAREIFARDQHVDGELGVLKNRGIVLALDLLRLEEARATFADAFARATAAGNAREALQARLYGAETRLRMKDAAEASRDFQAAHAAAVELETLEEQWKALYGLGRCALLLGNDAAAEGHLRRAVAVIEQIRDAIRVPSLRSDFFHDKREVFDALIALRLRHGAGAAELFELIERGHSRGWRERLGLSSRIDLRAVQRALPSDAVLLDYWTSSFGAAVVSVTSDSASVQRIVPPAAILPALPDGKPHVVVVPDAALASVAFELLPVAGRPLVMRAAVTYMPTAALLLRPVPPVRRWAPPWTTMLRGFADPLFGSAALEDEGVPRLVASAGEVRAIAAAVGGRSVLRIGEANRKEHLLEPSDAPLLHIASHAFVDPGAIEQSRILFSAARNGGPATYLFLKEAYELPLAKVELAVLSACDTERGRAVAGEGIESFSRAFLAAGARSTVTTLWRVPDATTASFMRVFYHHLQRGASRAEALRRAKLRFIEEGAHPDQWAAFVLTGDGLRPVSTALRWRTVIAALALLALLAALVLVERRASARRAINSSAG